MEYQAQRIRTVPQPIVVSLINHSCLTSFDIGPAGLESLARIFKSRLDPPNGGRKTIESLIYLPLKSGLLCRITASKPYEPILNPSMSASVMTIDTTYTSYGRDTRIDKVTYYLLIDVQEPKILE